MKKQKINFREMRDALSRTELRKLTGGSGDGTFCNKTCNGQFGPNTWCIIDPSYGGKCVCPGTFGRVCP